VVREYEYEEEEEEEEEEERMHNVCWIIRDF
jgi:hypothetical protein